jgi:hypothetical protein
MGEEPEPEPPKVEPPKRQITMASPGQKPAQPAPPSASVYRAPEPQYDVRAGRRQPAPKMIAEEKQQVRSVKSASFDSFDLLMIYPCRLWWSLEGRKRALGRY